MGFQASCLSGRLIPVPWGGASSPSPFSFFRRRRAEPREVSNGNRKDAVSSWRARRARSPWSGNRRRLGRKRCRDCGARGQEIRRHRDQRDLGGRAPVRSVRRTSPGPMWEELTGIKVNVIESQVNEMFPKMLQEHRAGTGAYDVLSVVPAWMGDMVRAGAVEPLDEYVDKYGYREELEDIGDVYRENQMRIGDTIYGFPDDGDVLILYFRKDIFEEIGPLGADHVGRVLRGQQGDHRREGARGLRRGLHAGARSAPLLLSGAGAERGLQVLRRRDHEGDGQRSRLRRGARRHGQGQHDHAARYRAVGRDRNRSPPSTPARSP